MSDILVFPEFGIPTLVYNTQTTFMTMFRFHAIAAVLLGLFVVAPATCQTFWGTDTLALKRPGFSTSIIPAQDSNVILHLPGRSGTLALESDVGNSGSGVSNASFVADTIIYGAEWVTVASIEVDSGDSGILEYFFLAGGENAVRLHFYRVYHHNRYVYTSSSATWIYGVQNYLAPTCYIGNGIRCLTYSQDQFMVVPFQFALETTATAVFWDEAGMTGRKGILEVEFATNEQSPENLDLQNNYQLARGGLTPTKPPLPRVHDAWSQRFFYAASSSGTVSLKFKNYRGRVRRGQSPAANQCCVYDMVDINTDLHLQQVRLLLH
jgi:hypothetical protein